MSKTSTQFKKGQSPWNKGIDFNAIKGQKHFAWKGEKVSYRGLHYWVERQLGKPHQCKLEDSTCKGMFEWANISGEYKRDLDDWQRLCRSHHRRLDNKRRTKCATA